MKPFISAELLRWQSTVTPTDQSDFSLKSGEISLVYGKNCTLYLDSTAKVNNEIGNDVRKLLAINQKTAFTNVAMSHFALHLCNSLCMFQRWFREVCGQLGMEL